MSTATDRYSDWQIGPSDVQELTDEQLLLNYQESGNRDVFARLVQRFETELFNYLRRYLGCSEQAEDVFQTTFLQVHLKCEQFEAGRKVRPWLYTIATNQAIDAQRKNKRHRAVSLDSSRSVADDKGVGALVDLLISAEPTPFSAVDTRERQRWIRNELENLPAHLGTVVNLVYYQGLKYREAADVLSIPVGTVKSRLHAAIHRLNEAWAYTHLEQE